MDENVYLYLRLDYGEYIELKDGIINIYSHFGGRVPIIDKLENFILVSYRVLWKKTVYITMMHLPSDRRYPSCKYFIKKGELQTGHKMAKNPLKEQQRREAEAAAQAALEEAQKPVLISCPCCGRQVSSQAVSCPGCGQPIAGAGGRPQNAEPEKKEFHGVYRVGFLGGKTEVHCPRCGSENCSIYKEQKIIPGKTELEYKKNINPLKPFTAGHVKEKVIREDRIVTEDKFMCNSCGKIFR